MSQDYTTNRKQRRAARGNRNRPVLVASSENATTPDREDAPRAAAKVAATTPAPAEPTAASSSTSPSRLRRLHGFFSTLGKSEQKSTQDKSADIAQARIARATRTKVGATGKTTAVKADKDMETDKSSNTKAAPTRTTSQPVTNRPASAFKTRYIFGMVVYLIAAQLIGAFETNLFQTYKMDSVLLQFPFFGGQATIRTSTVVYLAVLIIILVLLARFDLLPRSLSSLSNTPASSGRQSNSSDSSGSRKLPSVRQGVQGADDDLYQQYRANQRREKKK
jgi:hypothetical protein